MAETVTKKREGDVWRIYVSGRRSSVFIVKGDTPRYRQPQEYELWSDPEVYHATGKSVAGLMQLVSLIAGIALGEQDVAA